MASTNVSCGNSMLHEHERVPQQVTDTAKVHADKVPYAEVEQPISLSVREVRYRTLPTAEHAHMPTLTWPPFASRCWALAP